MIIIGFLFFWIVHYDYLNLHKAQNLTKEIKMNDKIQ